MPLLIRVQTRIGQSRVSVEASDSLQTLAEGVSKALPELPPFKLSRDPGHKDFLGPANATIAELRLQHGDRIFAQIDPQAAEAAAAGGPAAMDTPAATQTRIVGYSLSGAQVEEVVDAPSPVKLKAESKKDVVLDEVDEILSKLDGQEKLASAVKHGFGDQGLETMAVEPYDEQLLKEKDIKLMSFNAYLRKLKSVAGGGKFSELKRHDFGSYGESGGKGGQEKGWGNRTVSMNRLPKPMTLNRQKYRHVDRVEIESHEIFDKFLDAWRDTGGMRYGYLYGTYEQDVNVPLGIKSVVKAIYEPPQDCAADGVNMLDDPNGELVDAIAKQLGLRKVGWIFIDLEMMAEDSTKYVWSRRPDTYFLRSNECVIAARLQNMNPSPCRECDDGEFGSKFVTVVVTGNQQNELDYVAYQVSQQGMDLEKAEGILEWTSKSECCRVCLPSQDRYVPAIFYQDVSEFGNKTTHSAQPYFPVDYLVVSVNGPTFPQESNPLFNSSFPIENRITSPQSMHSLRTHLNRPENKPFKPTGQLKCLSDFHLIVYLAVNHQSILPIDDGAQGLKAMCEIVGARDWQRASEFMQSGSWLSLIQVVGASSDGDGAAAAGGFGEFGAGSGPVAPPNRAGSRPGTAAGSEAGAGRAGGPSYEAEADQLALMGFDKERAREMLVIVQGNVNLALDMLSSE